MLLTRPAPTVSKTHTVSSTLIAIDSGIESSKILTTGIRSGISWLILDPHEDGVEQISRSIKTEGPIHDLHIIAHGSQGCLYLGNTELSLYTLRRYAVHLMNWFIDVVELSHEVATWPSIHLYGDNIAAGYDGADFMERLHDLTKAKTVCWSMI